VRTSTRFRRERAAVPQARAFVQHTLRSAEAPGEIIERVVLATAEACNNAILHAAGEDFTLSVVVEGGRALVSVSDDGDGFEPPGRAAMPGPLATGRRGLALMQALVDDVDVTSGPSGTTVALVHDFSVAAVPAGASGS
jgi:anti-sigma regulatory factor (Ser/Thr protein kinase)